MEKMNPDPGHEHFLRFYIFFELNKIFQRIFLFRFFILKHYELFRDKDIFDNIHFLRKKQI